MKDKYQLTSWFDPSGYHKGRPLQFPEGWLIGMIYFATDETSLDAGDTRALDYLYMAYAPQLLGSQPQRFTMIGYADYRYTEQHNQQLGTFRASSVQAYLSRKFQSFRSFSSDARSRGAHFATRSSIPDILAGDRRVDIFAPFRINPPTIVLPPRVVSGGYTGTLIWEEFDPKVPNAPPGRHGPKPSSVGGRTDGRSLRSFVVFIQQSVAEAVVNWQIKRSMANRSGQAIGALRGHRSGGLVAEAYIIVTYNPSDVVIGRRGEKPIMHKGPLSKRLSYLNLSGTVYSRPEHGVSVRESEQRRHGHMEEPPNPDCEYGERRYFWVHWK
jgi:hypothetical protein